jgi:hypothetical protein
VRGVTRAGVADLVGRVVVGGDRGGIPAALGAVRLEREVLGRVFLVARFDKLSFGLLGLVAAQDRADLRPAAHRGDDLLPVRAGGVHLRLADLGDPDAKLPQRVAQRGLEVLGPVRVTVPLRVGDAGERAADELGELLRLVRRYAPEPVVVVPGQDVAALGAGAADLIGDEVRRHQLAQVAQVNVPGRADAAGAGGLLARVPALSLRDHLGRGAGHPVFVRLARCHVLPFVIR